MQFPGKQAFRFSQKETDMTIKDLFIVAIAFCYDEEEAVDEDYISISTVVESHETG
jgi:hypothetical protein